MLLSSDNVLKFCSRCKCEKSRSEFYKRSRAKDGLQAYCRECDKATTLEQRSSPEGREYVRRWRSSESGAASERAYIESVSGRKVHCKDASVHRKRNPLKTKARRELNIAVKNGTITKPLNCESCCAILKNRRDGRSGLQGHHPDYLKSLDVVWLCVKCHRSSENE